MSEQLQPAEVFSPGEFLKDELDERGWSQSEFADIIGRDVSLVNEIIKGKRAITPTTAKEIAAALGGDALFWMNMDAAYRLNQASDPSPRITAAARVRSRYPVRDMMARGWIQKTDRPEVVEASLKTFFRVESLDDEPTLPFAARMVGGGQSYERASPVQLAWIHRVRQVAEAMQVAPYSETALRDSLPELKGFMVDPEEIRHVPRVLERCGVRLVVVEPLPATKMAGVCIWLDQNKPVIGLTLQRDKIDNFWFNLRHEIEHVLARHVSIDFEIDPSDRDLPKEEQQANNEAGEFCVPQEELRDFIARKRPVFSAANVVGLAARLETHPGIVVGQLQNKLDRYNLLTKFQVKIRDIITSAAMTDGYGRELQLR